MAAYEFVCWDCGVLYEVEFDFGKCPRTIDCDDCSKDIEQRWASREIPIHFKGTGWTGKNSRTGLNKIGGSDEVNLQLQEKAKKRMEEGWRSYSAYSPKEKEMEKARKLTPDETAAKIKAAKEIGTRAYDNAGIDPTKLNKPQ